MPIGYAPTVRDVLAYYGEGRRDVAVALGRAGRGRFCEFYDRPTAFDLFGGDPHAPGLPDQLARAIAGHLRATMRGGAPDDVPVRYPGLHRKIGWDVVLEVDDKASQRTAYEGGKRIRDLLEGYGAPYRLKYSGNCSMHFILPQEIYEPWMPRDRRAEAYRRLFAWLYGRLKDRAEGHLDDAFRDFDNFLRMPYSLNERTGLVSLPLRPEQYDAFDLEWAEMGNVRVDMAWFDDEPLRRKAEGIVRLLTEALGACADPP